ncbi:MAG: ABC transporter ATP-binding protein [Actinoplanes sp.]
MSDGAADQPPAGIEGNGGRRLAEAFALAWAAAPWSVLVVGSTALAQGVVPVAIAWFTKLLLDDVAAPGAGAPWWVVAGLVASVALLTVLPHTAGYFQAELRRGVELTVQTRLFAAVNRVPGLGPFEQPAFHDRLQLAEQAGQSVPGQIVQSATALVQALVTQLGLISALVVVDWRIAAVALAVGVPALLAELHVSRARNALVWSLSPVRRQAMHYVMLQGDVQAAKEIRIFGLAGFLADRMAALIRRAHRDEHRLDGRELRVQTGLGAIAAATLAVGLIVAIGAAAGGRIGVGDLALALVALPAIQAGVGGIVRNVGLAHSALLLFDHYRAMVGEPVPRPGAAPPPLTAGIELRDVWFRYDDDQPWVLRGVDLTIPVGRTVALVGVNGAGKSTIVKLLSRLYDPTRGAVLWDGRDSRTFGHAELRRRISALFQDFMVYDLTAAENIGLGDLDRLGDPAAIRRAASHAGVHEAIEAMPQGYHTLLSRIFTGGLPTGEEQSGVLLSGGQWQRLATARALLREDCDLLILDEPSSGLDAEAAYQLQQQLHSMRAGRTTLLISHRLSTVREADLIVVLDHGRVTDSGTHDELMARPGRYAELFRRQAAGYQPELDTV